ncbi:MULTISPECIES: alanine racemase [Paenibacillus]|uniref:alanine racemase n=1 Tax=Paenibacillus TaxID=44249 RepID=UPI002FDFBA34
MKEAGIMISTPSKVSSRDTWAEVSLDAIAHNVALFRRQAAAECRVMAVVKANGYGHGAVQAARAARVGGADYLGVALLDEALHLREAGIQLPILVLGYTPPSAVDLAVRHDITLTVFSADVLREAAARAELRRKPARIHLKLDTGMSRIGLTSAEAVVEMAQQASACSPHIVLEGLFTHFADADGPDPGFTDRQYRQFISCIQALESRGLSIPLKHCCNSAAAMRFSHMHLDMIRVGIAMYGLHPSDYTKLPNYPLREAMQLKTKIVALRQIAKGDTVSYGRTYRADGDRLIATVPIGYADGLSRSLSNRGTAILRNRRVPIVGRVCMDQTMLDVTAVPDASEGDTVILFGGKKGRETIPIDEVAALMNTVNYEMVCLIGQRVPRVYQEEGVALMAGGFYGVGQEVKRLHSSDSR